MHREGATGEQRSASGSHCFFGIKGIEDLSYMRLDKVRRHLKHWRVRDIRGGGDGKMIRFLPDRPKEGLDG